MNLFGAVAPREEPPYAYIEIIEPEPELCPAAALPPEGNVKLRNYRVLNENLRAYTPTGDVHTSPAKGKLVSRWEAGAAVSPPRARILELVRPEDPGRDELEAIVRPAPRRGLRRPLDDDTRRFLQRALQSPSPYASGTPTPEPLVRQPSHAEELREAEDGEPTAEARRELAEGRREATERLGRLVQAAEEEEGGLGGAARRLDALLAESRALHDELAGIQQDLQMQSARACRCAAAARALRAEASSLRYLDDVVALLRGDVAAAARARAWPFAIGNRRPGRNYIV